MQAQLEKIKKLVKMQPKLNCRKLNLGYLYNNLPKDHYLYHLNM